MKYSLFQNVERWIINVLIEATFIYKDSVSVQMFFGNIPPLNVRLQLLAVGGNEYSLLCISNIELCMCLFDAYNLVFSANIFYAKNKSSWINKLDQHKWTPYLRAY